ncbi:hypothetical protein [Brevibacillus centrosporus]|uniref:hypothetical protein n=1 Tax=Brevibacillus centrosporus TaxID=54910 RepID=UPI00381652D6
MKRLYTVLLFCTLLSFAISGCTDGGHQNEQVREPEPDSKPAVTHGPISYENDPYGFRFSLPESWKGYSIVTGTWEGLAAGNESGETIVETGPLISIRHPQWTPQNQRQDIPIMIFTLEQWGSLLEGKFHIGAAPIGPTELGRNSKYVFALPARYNFAFPEGYEEVEEIIKRNPLQATLSK